MNSTNELIDFIRVTTRQYQFDFNKVAEAVNALANDGQVHIDQPISAQQCRELFAQDYATESVSTDSINTKQVTTVMVEEEHISIESVLRQQEIRRAENDKKMELIFQRVLSTLETTDKVALSENDEIVVARRRQVEMKEQERYAKAQLEAEQREQKFLDEQRMALRRRFEDGSEDTQGIDPFAEKQSQPPQPTDTLDSHPMLSEDVIRDFSMERLLDTAEFDQLLTQIEQDIDSRVRLTAAGKEDGQDEPLSELGEVLSFLNKSAEEKAQRPKATPNSGLSLPSPPVTAALPPNPPPPSTSKVIAAAESKCQPEQPSAKSSASVMRSGHLGGRGQPASRSDRGGRLSGYGGRGGRGRGATSARTALDDTESSGEDSDEDWTDMRQKLKRSVEPVDEIAVDPHSAGFWGAYGNKSVPHASESSTEILHRFGEVTSEGEEEGGSSEENDDGETDRNIANDGDTENEVVEEDEKSVGSDGESAHSTDVSPSPLPMDSENGTLSPEAHYAALQTKAEAPVNLTEHPPSPPRSGEISPHKSALPDTTSASASRSSTVNVPSIPPSISSRTSGGILGADTSNRRNRRTKENKLQSSVEAAKKRREEIQKKAAATAIPVIQSVVETPTLAEPAMEKSQDTTAESESVDEVSGANTNPLMPSDHPFCSVLPPDTIAVFSDTSSENRELSLKECQGLVVVQFDLSGPMKGGKGPGQEKSDAPVFLLLAWVTQKLAELEGYISAVQYTDDAEEDKTSYRKVLTIVVEGNTPHAMMMLPRDLMHAMQTANVSDVIEIYESSSSSGVLGSPYKGLLLSSIGCILPPDKALLVLQRMTLPPAQEAAGTDWLSRLNHNTIVSCVLKPYVMNSADILSTVFMLCEKYGLRLCGLRTAYVNRSCKETANLVHPDVVSPIFGKATSHRLEREDYNFVLVALFYSSRFIASESLRTLLGPDDPVLAQRTDPESVRAICGKSRRDNVAFPLSSLPSNCWKDAMFWFGPRNGSEGSPLSRPQYILLPPLRYAVVGIAIETHDQHMTLTNHQANLMAEMQRSCIQCVQQIAQGGMHFMSMWTCDRDEISRYGLATCGEADATHGPASYTVAIFMTHVGDVYYNNNVLSVLEKKVNEVAAKSENVFHVNVSMKLKEKFKRHQHHSAPTVNAKLLSTKLVLDEDLDSHEDVGLQDIVVCSIAAHRFVHDGAYTINPQEVILHILQALPRSCYASIIGVCTPSWDSAAVTVEGACELSSVVADKIYVCFRGQHLVENISSAVNIALDTVNTIASSAGGVILTSADVRFKNVRTPVLSDIKVLKGRRALDVICREFLPRKDCFLTDFATMSLQAYVPEWVTTHSVATGSLHHDLRILRALFCPGSFPALSVVVIPYPDNAEASLSGVFFRVLKKIEKEGFDVKHISSCLMSESMASYCADEIIQDGEDDTYCSNIARCELQKRFQLLTDRPVLSVVVQGNSALLRLRSIIGPIDPDVASEQYPLSVVANLASFTAIRSKSPLVFFSRTCMSTEKYLENICNCGLTARELYHCPPLSEFGSREHTASTTVVDAPGDSEVAAKEGAMTKLREKSYHEQKRMDKTSRVLRTIDSTSSTAMDATCIVLTSALLRIVGISSILQAINKEKIKVVHARTSLLHPTMTRKLMELAGQSSLSMKPSAGVLNDGPVLFLAMEGAAHSILRLKSILQQPTGGSGFSHGDFLLNVCCYVYLYL